MRFVMPRTPRWLAATALASLGFAAGVRPANAQNAAQYAPYNPAPQYAAQPQNAQPQYAPQQAVSPYGGYVPQQPIQRQAAQPQYAAQGAYQGYAAAQPGYGAPQSGAMPQQQQAAAPTGGYGPYTVPHMAMAYQAGAPSLSAPTPAAGESLQLTPPAENVPPGPAQGGPTQGGPMQGGSANYAPQPTPAAEHNYGYGGYAPTPSYESYPSAQPGAAGCATGNCNTGYGAAGYGAAGYGNATAYGACDTYSTYGGMGGVLAKHAGCGYWFGGVYGLYMDRDNSNKYSLAYVTDPSMPTAYPPAAMNVVMTTRSTDVGFQPGVEFRLGRAFGGGGCDPCGGCCGGPTWGLEGVYWTLFDEEDSATYVNPTATSRTYTMMPMYGLEYDHGTGTYMPVNDFWDHGMPSDPANTTRVTSVRTRSSFEAQNLELNLLRLNICGGGGCGGASYSAAYGPSACGGCDTGCATDGCTTGYGACAPACGPRYSCTAVCGFRWMQFDEDFMLGVDYFDNTQGWANSNGFLNYWSTVENNLIGAQIGCNGMYRVGCKWGLHLNTLVGLFGNDIDVHQYFVSPTGGNVRYIGVPGENFDAAAGKTDVSMLGEVRLGVSYQATCKCRLYGGWRAIGVSGLALATDQAPNAWLSNAQADSYVNSNGSMILHGLQTGVEFNY